MSSGFAGMANVGKLDQRITLQSKSRTTDNMGGAAEAWSDLPSTPTVWAQVIPARGVETLAGERVEAHGMFTFVIRNRTDVSENDRIVWMSEAYNIRHIERRGGRPLYLYISAERGVAH